MTFCKFFKNSIQPEDSFTGELTLSIRLYQSLILHTDRKLDTVFDPFSSSLEPSLVIYSMSQEDSEMVMRNFLIVLRLILSGMLCQVRLLNKRLMMYIGVQGSVESILGAIFETYLRWSSVQMPLTLAIYILYIPLLTPWHIYIMRSHQVL